MLSYDDIKRNATTVATDAKDVAVETWNVLDWPVQDFSAVVGLDAGWVAMLLIAGKALAIGWAGARAYARRHKR